jgi:phosphatidylserine/phosphatidylglycerophosphate/cardiolipin synthase-like enzyme
VVNASVFKPAATSPDQQIFYFYNISYEFKDVADPNGQLPDAAASAIAKAAAQGMRVGPPKDFSLTVKWPADYCVKVIVNDNGPNEYAFVPVGYLRTSDLSSWKRPLTQ